MSSVPGMSTPAPAPAAHAAADRALTELLDTVTEPAWNASSPCAGWSARDVVAHLVQTQRAFFAERDRPLPGDDELGSAPAEAWRQHSARVAAVLADPAAVNQAFDGFVGPTTLGETFVRFYVLDMLVHRWDVATATGRDAGLTPDELEQIDGSADGFGDALHMEGICGPALTPPDGGTRQAQVLARLGRRDPSVPV